MKQGKPLNSDCDDEYGFPEFTDQEVAQIDAIFEEHRAATSNNAATNPTPETLIAQTIPEEAQAVIQVEQEITTNEAAVQSEPTSTPTVTKRAEFRSYVHMNPFDSYRSWKPLSVSDLTGPAWYVSISYEDYLAPHLHI